MKLIFFFHENEVMKLARSHEPFHCLKSTNLGHERAAHASRSTNSLHFQSALHPLWSNLIETAHCIILYYFQGDIRSLITVITLNE